ncbi:hypothetical protein CLOM_g12581 [Closterium sp. NIES-68]|nr:hypothetical protein CLOM_g4953 [Closterium sp. NIES-68]GJP53428.1 hypothetical protein CLOM_g12581 [Closterium sp. NIES-68]GJP79988.1 hypothetical protein CLOP_g10213 [Closterium sp. NIES-67]GJP85452.1 hypothetical protein CLOP_g15554 [Closterium sp. NIES-67]
MADSASDSAAGLAPDLTKQSAIAAREAEAARRTGRMSDGMCAGAYADSLKCLDKNSYDKSKCEDKFDAYKECRKVEREKRLEANSKKSFFG